MAQPTDATAARLQRHHSSHSIVVRVGNAANGVVYSVRLASTDLIVAELCEQVATFSDVPMNDQILLGGPPFTRLDPRRTLGYYGLPDRDKHIYLYDRRMLSQDNPLPPRLALEPVDFEFPTTPVVSSENSRILSESMSPLIRALPDYEAHFQLQLNQSEALERSSAANVAACERCVAELHVQAGAITAAVANLDTFRDTMNKHFSPFWSEFETAAATHETLLANFDTYVAALKTVPLHPALRTDDRATLYDCIPVDREREWAVQCEQSHNAMRTQVARLKQVHDEIYGEVGVLVRSQDQVSLAYADTTQELERLKQFVAAHAEITAKLTTNVEFVSNRIAASATAEGNAMFASTAMLDVCRDIERLYQEQFESIPSAQKLAEEIKATMGTFSSVKASFFTRVHANLRKISVSQSKIRDFENSLAMLKEALAAQKKQFSELDHLKMLPEAYTACLKEIARRVRYGSRFSDRIQSMAEELAQMRDDEVHHRDVFLRNFGHHMPRDLVPGLAEKPSHCEFRMRPFDQNLPQIEDLEDDVADGNRSGAGSATESKEEDEFFESRANDGLSAHGGSNAAEVDVLQRRCEELEAKVAELTLELQQNKKGSSYFSDGSLAQSDISKTSLREGDSSCEFPLVLALAATAGGMTSSSEADRSNLLERELQSLKGAKAEIESQDREKDAQIAKLENDNQQYLLNATALEEYPFSSHVLTPVAEIQERTRRETQLLDNQAKLQQSVRELQLSVEMQRSALVNLLKQLDLLPSHDRDLDPAQFIATHLDLVGARIRELTTIADSEQNLRRELAQKSDEINLLESQHLDVTDSFKISFRSFNYDDVALFLPTSVPGSDAQRVYLAFHHGCPHRFLSEESISSFMIGGRKYPDYVVGRIVLIDEQVASETHNPYGLHMGTTFYILTVASLQDT